MHAGLCAPGRYSPYNGDDTSCAQGTCFGTCGGWKTNYADKKCFQLWTSPSLSYTEAETKARDDYVEIFYSAPGSSGGPTTPAWDEVKATIPAGRNIIWVNSLTAGNCVTLYREGSENLVFRFKQFDCDEKKDYIFQRPEL